MQKVFSANVLQFLLQFYDSEQSQKIAKNELRFGPKNGEFFQRFTKEMYVKHGLKVQTLFQENQILERSKI